MGWDNWKAVAVVPLTFGIVALIAFAFMADANAAASFFGAFAAAGATVIAVLLSAHMQRRNERERDRRKRDTELAAIATELSIALSTAEPVLESVRRHLQAIADWNERNVTLGLRKPEPLLHESVSETLSMYCPPLADRMKLSVGRFPRPVAEAIMAYISISEGVSRIMATVRERPLGMSDPWVSQYDAKQFESDFRKVRATVVMANKALLDYLNTIDC